MVDRTARCAPARHGPGKVLLAALSPAQLEPLFFDLRLHKFTAKTIGEKDALLPEIEEVRRKGLAFRRWRIRS